MSQQIRVNEEDDQVDDFKTNKNSKTQKKQKMIQINLHMTFTVVYLGVVVGFSVVFFLLGFVRTYTLTFLSAFTAKSILNYIIIGIFGVLLKLGGFPSEPFEMFLGYKWEGSYYWTALILDVCIIFVACTFIFMLTHYLFKKKVDEKLNKYALYETIQSIIGKNPIKFVSIIQLMSINESIQNYGLAMTPINYFQYIIPTMIIKTVYGILWIALGRSITSINHIGNNTESQDSVNIPVARYCFVFLTYILLIYAVFKAGTEYIQNKQLKENMNRSIDKTMDYSDQQNLLESNNNKKYGSFK